MKNIFSLHIHLLCLLTIFVLSSYQAYSQRIVIAEQMLPLRRGSIPEWSTFPEKVKSQLMLSFDSEQNGKEYTLSCRQEDVKQTWRILLNGQEIGKLLQDENPIISYWPVPRKYLRKGKNTLQIVQADTLVDDIRIGEIRLHAMPTKDLLSQAKVTVRVVDKQTGKPLPSRLTITSAGHALQTVGATSNTQQAVRPGMIYMAHGKTSFGLPPGKYTLYATRGFEYGVDSVQVTLKAGEAIERKLTIAREVPTSGWISTDTHIHTYTYSRHGDASLAERAITIAAENIELPVLTDHNVHISIDSAARALDVRRYYTPVTGNEVTTKVGHFNVFPVAAGSPPADHRIENWQAFSRNVSVQQPSPISRHQAIILNHARDIHQQFRPFGEDRHIAVAGMNLDGWVLPANAMEVINSGSQQNNQMQLFEDWMGMLNRGHALTPIGASDSHDVGRYLVGQARTYIACKDDDPGNIDLASAMASLVEGKVMVSFGLMANLAVNQPAGASAEKETEVTVTVLGPAWVRAGSISLYANGSKIREQVLEDKGIPGIKWKGSWKIPLPKHDFYLVAIARGPGNYLPFWPIAKPYQPTSPVWQPGVIGCSGAIWIDVDGDGKRSNAYSYAQQLVAEANGNWPWLLERLSGFDEAVAIQAASLVHEQGTALTDPAIQSLIAKAPKTVKDGFLKFEQARKLSWQSGKK